MEKPELLYKIFELIVLVIPIGALIWKAAKQSTRIEEMTKQIEVLQNRVSLNEKQSAEDRLEIKDAINKINVTNAEILTSLSFIKDQIAEKKVKEK